MAPSRGLATFFSAFSYSPSPFHRRHISIHPKYISRAYTSIPASSFVELAARPASKHQIYISRSQDPYLNLSIEHFLLQRSPPESVILFLYTNRPSIIIGRNQNPWVEVNLRLLDAARAKDNDTNSNSNCVPPETEPPGLGDVWLVRRRSGGGTVFHDQGNVNYSVMCPPAEFTRDKHAEMVVRALRSLGIDRARVNERHDIVLDQGSQRSSAEFDQTNTHRTAYASDDTTQRPLKISGSAYKLTRQRSLHHGTCLLSSPNLNIIPDYLHAPAKPYIKARGVESVSSPVGNVGVSNADFERAVVEQFCLLHGVASDASTTAINGLHPHSDHHWVGAIVDEVLADVPEISKGMAELKSLEWTYLQTPQFTLSSHPTPEDPRERPPLDSAIPPDAQISLKSRSGIIQESAISTTSNDTEAQRQATNIHHHLSDLKIHQIQDWAALLRQSRSFSSPDHAKALGTWLGRMFGKA